MGALVAIPVLLVAFGQLGRVDPPKGSDQEREPGEAVRQLSAEFDVAQREAVDKTRLAKTERERSAAMQALPDRRAYSRRFLELARTTNDQATAIDCLVWVGRHGFRTPESDEAVRQIAMHYLRSDRIGGICHPLGARGAEGEHLLHRILEENPDPGVRGRACLGLAYARSLLLGEVERSSTTRFEQRPEGFKAPAKDLLDQRKKSETDLAGEIERWLGQVLDEYPRVLLDEDIQNDFGTLSNNLGLNAERILRRVAELHPLAETHREAECALVAQQMKLASLVADVRAAAAAPPGAKTCAGLELAVASGAGGETRLDAVDSGQLVREIEQRLQAIVDHATEVREQAICFNHLIMDSPTLSEFHAGTERLLRRLATGHPDPRYRSFARRSLAIYLAELAHMSDAIASDPVRWLTRLGSDRVEQLRSLVPERLSREAAALADQVAKENKEAGRAPDPKIENLRKTGGRSTG
jgi:hypothetical protein